jgi:hypothetical protein
LTLRAARPAIDYVLAIAPLVSILLGAFICAAGVRRTNLSTRALGVVLMTMAPLAWIAWILIIAAGSD